MVMSGLPLCILFDCHNHYVHEHDGVLVDGVDYDILEGDRGIMLTASRILTVLNWRSPKEIREKIVALDNPGLVRRLAEFWRKLPPYMRYDTPDTLSDRQIARATIEMINIMVQLVEGVQNNGK